MIPCSNSIRGADSAPAKASSSRASTESRSSAVARRKSSSIMPATDPILGHLGTTRSLEAGEPIGRP